MQNGCDDEMHDGHWPTKPKHSQLECSSALYTSQDK